MDRKNMEAAAEELNTLMELEPKIESTKLKVEKLIAKIKEAAKELNETDVITEATADVLVELECEVPCKVQASLDDDDKDEPEDDEDEEETPAEDDEDEEEEEDDEDEEEEEEEDDEDEEEEPADLASKLAKAKKLTELKELVEKNDEFKKLRKSLDEFVGLAGPRDLKAKMYKTLGIEPPAKVVKEKKPKGPTKKSICEEMVSRKGGATCQEMGEAITKAGIDPDTEKNTKTAKLWMPKISFKVSFDKKTGKYAKA